jgi:hypothetical protein
MMKMVEFINSREFFGLTVIALCLLIAIALWPDVKPGEK